MMHTKLLAVVTPLSIYQLSWGVFSIWLSMLASIPSTSNVISTHALQVIGMWLQFGSAWSVWTVIMKEKTAWLHLAYCERVAYIGILAFFIIKTSILYCKNGLVRPCKYKSLLSQFSTWVLTGSPISINRHTGLQRLWISPPLLFKCNALLSYRTYPFSL